MPQRKFEKKRPYKIGQRRLSKGAAKTNKEDLEVVATPRRKAKVLAQKQTVKVKTPRAKPVKKPVVKTKVKTPVKKPAKAKPAKKPVVKTKVKTPVKKPKAKPAKKPVVKTKVKTPVKKPAKAKPAKKPVVKTKVKTPVKKPAKAKPAKKPVVKTKVKTPVKKPAKSKPAKKPVVKTKVKTPVKKPAKAKPAKKPVVKTKVKTPAKKRPPRKVPVRRSRPSQAPIVKSTPKSELAHKWALKKARSVGRKLKAVQENMKLPVPSQVTYHGYKDGTVDGHLKIDTSSFVDVKQVDAVIAQLSLAMQQQKWPATHISVAFQLPPTTLITYNQSQKKGDRVDPSRYLKFVGGMHVAMRWRKGSKVMAYRMRNTLQDMLYNMYNKFYEVTKQPPTMVTLRVAASADGKLWRS